MATRVPLAVSVIASVCGVAAAQLIFPIEQARRVEGQVSVDAPVEQSDVQVAEAPDMALWVQDVEASVADLPQYGMYAGAGQYSEIGSAALTAFGVADVDAQTEGLELDGSGWAKSRYRVQFAVAQPVVYDLSGSVAALADGTQAGTWAWEVYSTVTVRLDQVAGPVVYDGQLSVYVVEADPEVYVNDSLTVAAAGELSPGVYELEVVATVNVSVVWFPSEPLSLLAEASYVVELELAEIPVGPECEATDSDGDGDVDLLDFYRLQHCFAGPGA